MVEIHAATDYFDEVGKNNRTYDVEHLRDLMSYLADMGLNRVEWIYVGDHLFELNALHTFDLLSEAVDAAHANGLEFHAVVKPFEGALGLYNLPHSLPRPDGVPVLKLEQGLCPMVDPFLAEHPEMRLRRNPELNRDPGGSLQAIRLVKDNDAPTDITADDLTILTSETITGFEPYDGPVEVRESEEWRDNFPKVGEFIVNVPRGKFTGENRIIHLEGLDIDESDRFVLVRYREGDGDGDGEFTNELGQMVELENERGERIPHTPGEGPASHPLTWVSDIVPSLSPYLRHPEVEAAVDEAISEDLYRFERDSTETTAEHALDEDGYVCAMRGKPEYLTGNLHPTYDAVREHWLELVRECIDAGVDGVNFRIAHHTRSHAMWEYGYNEPVLDDSPNGVDHAAVAQANGKAYTTFLREAAGLLRERNRQVGVHLHVELFTPDERPHGIRGSQGVMHLPANFEWEWETWVEEIADYVEFRKLANVREWRRERIVDRVARAVRDAPRPVSVIYQGHIKPPMYNPKHPDFVGWEPLLSEIEFADDHPGIDAYQLYETANFTHLEDGTFEGDDELADVIADRLDE